MAQMNKLSVKKVSLLLLFMLVGLTVKAQDNVIDEVVWVVGDEAILKSDVENERLNAQYEGRRFDGDPYCVIPEELAVQKLFLHQAEIDSIEVSEQEVIQKVEQQTAWLIEQIGSKEKMEEYYNKTSTQIREMLRENIRNGLIVQQMQRELVGDIKLTPAEVRNYFKNLPPDSIPSIPTQVEVQIITREPKIKEEEIERVKKTLREFTDRIYKGESFSMLARFYSEDPGSARRGGEYGFTGRGELTPEFANVIFNMTDPKKISKVFETEYGYHIAQLIEKRGDRVSYRHILMKPKVDEAEIEEALNKLDTLANDIRKGKVTFDEAATWVSQDKDTKNNHGLLANPQTGTSRFEMQHLAGMVSQEVAKVVEGMQIYQRLKSMVTAKRSEEKIQEWIVEKQKTTYVRINQNWRNCDFKYPGWIKK